MITPSFWFLLNLEKYKLYPDIEKLQKSTPYQVSFKIIKSKFLLWLSFFKNNKIRQNYDLHFLSCKSVHLESYYEVDCIYI